MYKVLNPGLPFDSSLLKQCDLVYYDISFIAEHCEKEHNFSPYETVSLEILMLNVLELTSIDSTDDDNTIKTLVDTAQLYSREKLKPILDNLSNEQCYKLYTDKYDNRILPNNVCVSSLHVKTAFDRILLNQSIIFDTTMQVISVAGGFPFGKVPIDSQISEVKYAISQGAKEIDLVIDRGLAIEGDFKTLYYNVNTIKGICEEHNVILKTILSVAELESYTLVYKAALTVMMAGSNFICTSTGKETKDLALCYGVVMCRAIKKYFEISGRRVGIKVTGGIVQNEQVLGWMILVKQMLGIEWMNKEFVRIGGLRAQLENMVKKLSTTLINFG